MKAAAMVLKKKLCVGQPPGRVISSRWIQLGLRTGRVTHSFSGTDVVRVITILSVPFLALLAGCTTFGGVDRNSKAVEVVEDLPPPVVTTLQAQQRPFRIGPFDTVSVQVFGATELDRTGMVDGSGTFGMPLIGPVAAAGLTTGELADAISERLRGRYLKDPQVSVNVTEVRSQRVTVDGAVRQPGIYPVVGRMTLQEAIATAKGTDALARLSQVVVFRTVGEQRMAGLFSLKDIREGRYPDPEIYGNDVIVVGESAVRRTLQDVSQALPALGVFSAIR
jgi:polysaccharide export outer membrane protein